MTLSKSIACVCQFALSSLRADTICIFHNNKNSSVSRFNIIIFIIFLIFIQSYHSFVLNISQSIHIHDNVTHSFIENGCVGKHPRNFRRGHILIRHGQFIHINGSSCCSYHLQQQCSRYQTEFTEFSQLVFEGIKWEEFDRI